MATVPMMSAGIARATRVSRVCSCKRQQRLTFVVRDRVSKSYRRVSAISASKPVTEPDVSGVISGEWTSTWSLASYEDLNEFYAQQLCNDTAIKPSTVLAEVMQKDVKTVTADMSVESVKPLLSKFSGCPVVDQENRLVGVISRKDMEEKTGACVKDVMTSPAVATAPTAKVADAAVLMLKHKMGRIPVIDKNSKLVGMISKSDVFRNK